MPALDAFGRKWNIASDDFVFPEITEGFIRLAWTGFALAVFIYHYPLNCSLNDVTVPVFILLAINALTVCIAFSTAAVSARGTIMIARPRRHISTLLYLRIPLIIVEFIWTIYSSVAVFESYVDRSNKTLSTIPVFNSGNFTKDKTCQFSTVIKITVVLEWFLFICAIFGIIVVFHPASEEDVEDMSIITRRIWSRRFRLFKIRQDQLMRAALDDLANLFASFFQSNDIVFSDVAAGLLLVVHSPTNVYPPLVPCSLGRPSWMTEKNALHYLRFAASVYGWPTYLLNNIGCTSCFKLCRKLQCCGRLSCDQVLIVEDNCCFCHTAAFILENEQHNIDLYYVSFRNRLYEVPFAVLTDHTQRSVVVAIRGSCSLSDLITDLCLNEEILSEDVDSDPILRSDPTLDPPSSGGQVRVHKGMLNSARYIYKTLIHNQTLEELFVLHPNYNLVVCGHSLGAGVASLLTLFLKQKYPAVQCFSFAPPGCVVSEEGIGEMERHVMSVVCGDDVVSRISYHALFRLREKVEVELRACQRPKYEILIKGIFRLFWKTPWEMAPLSGNNLENSDRSELINSIITEYGTRPVDDRVQLFAPGKILYIGTENFQPVKEWIDPKCLSDIKLSSSAVTDHMPKHVEKILQGVIELHSTSNDLSESSTISIV